MNRKTLIYLVVIAGLAIGVLWFIGGKKLEYSSSIDINASPEQVFRFLSDAEQLTEWATGVEAVESASDFGMEDVPEAGLGAISQLLVVNSGKKVAVQHEIIKYEPSSLISMRFTSPSLTSFSIFRLDEKETVSSGVRPETTRVSFRVKESTHGFSRFFVPFSGKDVERIQEELRKLKQLVEANPEAAAPLPVQPEKQDKEETEDSTETDQADQDANLPTIDQ